MYPSTNNNGDYSFTSSTIQPRTLSSFYDSNTNINLSQPPPFQYLLSSNGITFGDGTILSCSSAIDHRHQNIYTNTVVHEQYSNHDDWAMQCALGKSSDNNGRVVNGDAKNSVTIRRSKKDRHSKINTARGPRDRRMRLSVEVAKKFFKLQDMLGFDKASKTVEWLLMKSITGIQELHPPQLIRRSSECEALSENIDDQCMVKSSSSSDHKETKKTDRGVRKSAYLVRPLAKETREKARARARERTMVKSNRLGGGGGDQYSIFKPCLDPDLNLLNACNFNEPGQPIPRFQLKQISIDDNSSHMTNNWSPSLFNYLQTGVPHEVINTTLQHTYLEAGLEVDYEV